ncbi:MAG: NYN domain-containing protein [Planctomycetota bacterium]|jgi:uncharacterized LabA/DUF88 family protein
MRSIIYIDGFNLYYSALLGKGKKWLDLERCFRNLRPHDEIQRIDYYSALKIGKEVRQRQMNYLEVLGAMPLVNVVLGKFKRVDRRCRVRDCARDPMDRGYKAWEEKMTDVNIATRMIDDACQDEADALILVSGDTDLVPPLSLIKHRFPEKKLIVYVPGSFRAKFGMEFAPYADKRNLPTNIILRSQLPREVSLPGQPARRVKKPSSW